MLWFPLDLRIAQPSLKLFACEARLFGRTAIDGSTNSLRRRALAMAYRVRNVGVRDPELVSLAFFVFLIGLTFLL